MSCTENRIMMEAGLHEGNNTKLSLRVLRVLIPYRNFEVFVITQAHVRENVNAINTAVNRSALYADNNHNHVLAVINRWLSDWLAAVVVAGKDSSFWRKHVRKFSKLTLMMMKINRVSACSSNQNTFQCTTRNPSRRFVRQFGVTLSCYTGRSPLRYKVKPTSPNTTNRG